MPREMTLEEYLTFERRSEGRHEYVAGFVYAMSGASKRHNRIVARLLMRALAAEGASGCRAYAESVALALGDRVYYPDLMVTCGPPSADEYLEHHPSILVEVLSESTYHVDRREKLIAYREIESLHTYLIVAQDERYVHHHWRDADGRWHYDVLLEQGEVPLSSLGIVLTLDDIYDGIELTPASQRLRIRELTAVYGAASPSFAGIVHYPLQMTEREYLAFDRESAVHHEYVEGFVYPLVEWNVEHVMAR
jgi:Uma2 family endonuclease